MRSSAPVRFYLFIILIFSLLPCTRLSAQCTTTVSTFPYTEDFETSMGGWTSGGTSNDWAWGTPSKPVITGAGSGTKCWITGGLTTSFYNYGERSYVTSPCFDFTSIQHPFIAFLIFWESEHTYDGMDLQYSLNGGTTWTNIGTNTDPANCMTQNWYNTASINGLAGLANPKNGWTGNIQPTAGSCQGGSGSGAWVVAKHCMAELAGQSSVQFRFAFGAGTTCNDFDGIAFDSVSISEAPLITADFSYTCQGANQLAFTGITTLCPDSFAWDFGDPGSGASNTATTQNATHTFSAPGTYTVSFTAAGPCNAPATITKVVNFLDIHDSITDVLCHGANTGAIDVTASGGTSPYTYNWGGGVTSQNRTGLASGTYTVTVTDSNNCSATASAMITQPVSALSATATPTNASCSTAGSIAVSASGGTGRYSYNWGGGDTAQNRTGLGAGSYTVTVTDQNGCTATASATISSTSTLNASYTQTNVSCPGGNNGAINLSVNGGLPPYTYNWGGGVSSQNRTGLTAGTYTATVTDSNGCMAFVSVIITQPAAIVITDPVTNISCHGGSNGAVTVSVTGGTTPYSYDWGGGITTQNRTGLSIGAYSVTVTDSSGCRDSSTVSISQPSAIVLSGSASDLTCGASSDGSISTTESGGKPPYTYTWSPNVSSISSPGSLGAGTYYLTVTDSSGCTAVDSFTILASTATITAPYIGPDTSICPGYDTLTLQAGAYSTYLWQNGSTGASLMVTDSGTYWVRVTNASGCVASDTIVIGDSCNTDLVMPDAFTPNGDGRNDVFVALANAAPKQFTMHVYNSWGQLIFESNNIQDGWDGTYKGVQQMTGVYVYFVQYSFGNDKSKAISGNLTLLR